MAQTPDDSHEPTAILPAAGAGADTGTETGMDPLATRLTAPPATPVPASTASGVEPSGVRAVPEPIGPGTLLSHTYRVEGLIARGGMGEVHRARHVDMDTWHAVKVIRPELAQDAKMVELLRREAARIRLPEPQSIDAARLVASLDHPGAADLFDRYARNVAVGLANLQQTVAPNTFILHGDVVKGGPRLIDAIAGHLKAMVPERPGTTLEILPGDAGDRAALIGAAGLILSDLLHFQI